MTNSIGRGDEEKNAADVSELSPRPAQHHSPLPWVRNCFLITSRHGDEVAHTGFGHLPPSRSKEAEANAEFIVRAVNAHDILVSAAEGAMELIERYEDVFSDLGQFISDDYHYKATLREVLTLIKDNMLANKRDTNET